MERIIALVKKDALRLKAIDSVRQLGLPNCYLAAGFIRNLVWDDLHQKSVSTPLNDVDVIYFDETESNPDNYGLLESKLQEIAPELKWEVRNQALMHLKNGDKPYLNIIDAMSYWPELETAVAIRRLDSGQYECISSFGFKSLFDMQVTHNPKRSLAVFCNRVKSKEWLLKWPQLKIVQ